MAIGTMLVEMCSCGCARAGCPTVWIVVHSNRWNEYLLVLSIAGLVAVVAGWQKDILPASSISL